MPGTLRKPLVMNGGHIEQLQAGDILDAPVTDATVVSYTNGSGSPITQGQAVYFSAADTVQLAKANASGTVPAKGLVFAASISANPAAGSIILDGLITMADWTAVVGSASLTAGTTYYLSAATAGLLTAAAPTVISDYVQEIGFAVDTTTMLINIKTPILL